MASLVRSTTLWIVVFALFSQDTQAQQYVPDGTLVMSNKKGLIGRIARRITGGDQYTHVGIVIDGKVCESDFPFVKCTPVGQYGKRRTTNDYFVPAVAYSPTEVSAMRHAAVSRIGQPYRLRNYFFPRSRPTNGTWCSPYVGNVLNASGRYGLSSYDMYEPQNILRRVGGQYIFSNRVVR